MTKQTRDEMTRKETATTVVICNGRRVAGADSVSLSTAIEIRLKLKETALYIYTCPSHGKVAVAQQCSVQCFGVVVDAHDRAS